MPEPSDALKLAGAEAIDDLAQALIRTTAAYLKTHGPDPNQPAIVASAFVCALQRMTDVSPQVAQVAAIMLAKRYPSAYDGAIEEGMRFVEIAQPDAGQIVVTAVAALGKDGATVWFREGGDFSDGTYTTEAAFRRRFKRA